MTSRFTRFLRLQVPFLGAFAVGFLIRLRYPPSAPFFHESEMLGDAFMIAGIVGLLIEIFSARVLIHEVSDELTDKLVGYGLPEAAQAVIRELVLETRLVRRNFRKTFYIEDLANGHVRLEMTTSFVVVNNGIGAQSYSPMMQDSEMYNPSITRLEYGSYVHSDSATLIFENLNGVMTWRGPKKISLKPSRANLSVESLSVNQKCHVYWSHSAEMPAQYSDVTSFAGITIDPELQIECSESLRAWAETSTYPCEHRENSNRWTYSQAFIKGQHIRIWWEKTCP